MSLNNCNECNQDVAPVIPLPCTTCDCNPGYCNEGCADYPPSQCILYNGITYSCMGISQTLTPKLSDVIAKLVAAYCDFSTSGQLDKFVRVSSTDTVSGYLQDKLLQGSNISITKSVNGSGNEVLVIANTFTETSFAGIDSDGISYTAGGVHGHSPIYKVKLDPATDGALSLSSTGLKLVLPVEPSFTANNGLGIQGVTGGSKGHSPIYNIVIDPTSNSGLSVGSSGLKLVLPTVIPETSLVATDSSSVDFTQSGTAGHTFTAIVKVDSTQANGLSINANGLYVVPPVTFTETSFIANDSSTIDFTQSGTHGHTITADVKISSVTGNQLTNNTGLYVPVETSLVVTDSQSIDFTNGGTRGHNLTAVVRIDGTQPNALSVNGNGLYVAQSVNGTLNHISRFVSAHAIGDSAITDDGTTFTIPQATSISKTGGVTLTLFQGDQPNGVTLNAYGQSIFQRNIIISNTIGQFTATHVSQIDGSGITQTNQTLTVGSLSTVYLNTTGTNTLNSLSVVGGHASLITKLGSASFSGGMLSNYSAISSFGNSGNIQRFSGIRVLAPKQETTISTPTFTGVISNLYGIFLDASNTGDITSQITNTYGVYQEGSMDKNFFAGNTGIGVLNTGLLKLLVTADSNQSTALRAVNVKPLNNSDGVFSITSSLDVNNGISFTHSIALPISPSFHTLSFSNTASLALKSDNVYSAVTGYLVGSSTAAITLEAIASLGAKANLTDNGTYLGVAGLIVYPPDSVPYSGHAANFGGVISNYYGVLLKDSTTGTLTGTITNRYGIYQAGATDKNHFAGVIETSNDIEVTVAAKGIILKDAGDGTRRRLTCVNGVVTVSSPL